MPKGKRQPKKESSKLVQALEFLSLCQDNAGATDNDMFCSIQNNQATAFDGILGAGIRVDEDLDACPHTHQLLKALRLCGDSFTITQLSPESLGVRSEAFGAYIPCVKRESLKAVNPEAPVLPLAQGLTGALEIVAPLVSDKADTLEAASIYMRPNSFIATNREMITEAWHGSNLSALFEGILIPKVFAHAIIKSKKQPRAIAIKPTLQCLFGKQPEYESMTIWFTDDSWLKCNLWTGKWRQDIFDFLKLPTNPKQVNEAFFDAVSKLAPFSEDGRVYCRQGSVSSHYHSNSQGSTMTLPVEHGPIDKVYKIKNLLLAGKHSTSYDDSFKQLTMFYGPVSRSAVWHDPLNGQPVIPEINSDDDIPF